jgi:hypothetical protein
MLLYPAKIRKAAFSGEKFYTIQNYEGNPQEGMAMSPAVYDQDRKCVSGRKNLPDEFDGFIEVRRIQGASPPPKDLPHLLVEVPQVHGLDRQDPVFIDPWEIISDDGSIPAEV